MEETGNKTEGVTNGYSRATHKISLPEKPANQHEKSMKLKPVPHSVNYNGGGFGILSVECHNTGKPNGQTPDDLPIASSSGISPPAYNTVLGHLNSVPGGLTPAQPASRFRKARIRETVELWSSSRLYSHDCRLKSVPDFVIELHQKRQELKASLKQAIEKNLLCYSCLGVNSIDLPCVNDQCLKPNVVRHSSRKSLMEAAEFACKLLATPASTGKSNQLANSALYTYWQKGVREARPLPASVGPSQLERTLAAKRGVNMLYNNNNLVVETEHGAIAADFEATISRGQQINNVTMTCNKDERAMSSTPPSISGPVQQPHQRFQRQASIDPATEYLRVHKQPQITTICDSIQSDQQQQALALPNHVIAVNMASTLPINNISHSVEQQEHVPLADAMSSSLSDSNSHFVPPTSPALAAHLIPHQQHHNEAAQLLPEDLQQQSKTCDEARVPSREDPIITVSGTAENLPSVQAVPVSLNSVQAFIDQRIGLSMHYLRKDLLLNVGESFTALTNENAQLRSEVEFFRGREQQWRLLCQVVHSYVPQDVWNQVIALTHAQATPANGIDPSLTSAGASSALAPGIVYQQQQSSGTANFTQQSIQTQHQCAPVKERCNSPVGDQVHLNYTSMFSMPAAIIEDSSSVSLGDLVEVKSLQKQQPKFLSAASVSWLQQQQSQHKRAVPLFPSELILNPNVLWSSTDGGNLQTTSPPVNVTNQQQPQQLTKEEILKKQQNSQLDLS